VAFPADCSGGFNPFTLTQRGSQRIPFRSLQTYLLTSQLIGQSRACRRTTRLVYHTSGQVALFCFCPECAKPWAKKEGALDVQRPA